MTDPTKPAGTAPQSYTIAQPVPWLWDVLFPTVAVGFLCGAFVTRYRLSCMSVIACLVFIAFFVYKVFPALRDLAFGQIDSLEGVVEKDIVRGRMGDFYYLKVPGRIKMQCSSADWDAIAEGRRYWFRYRRFSKWLVAYALREPLHAQTSTGMTVDLPEQPDPAIKDER